jgi:hypothetical protein
MLVTTALFIPIRVTHGVTSPFRWPTRGNPTRYPEVQASQFGVVSTVQVG